MSQQQQTSTAKFVVVLVLYRMRLEDSPAFLSLRHGLKTAGLEDLCDLLVWDNSPERLPTATHFDATLIHDPANPGLAVAYNRGLQMAVERDRSWLILLDQDTVVTEDYLRELRLLVDSVPEDVSILLPRLVHRGRTVSPVWFRAVRGPVAYAGASGPVSGSEPLQGFNSGAAVRVAAMQAIGGFDLRFPLDYLDHATFAVLQRAGANVVVMQATLQHSLASDTGHASTAAERERQQSVLTARRRYLTHYAPPGHRLLSPLKALREAAAILRRKHDLPGALQVLRHLFSR